jgi:hypothetical protein
MKESQKCGKSGHNSRLRIDTETLDRLRLKINDRFVWLIDSDRKAIAIQLDLKGNCTLIKDHKKANKNFRLHTPKEVADFIREEWSIGSDQHAESVAVDLVLSSGVIEIRRTTNEPT